MGALLLRRPVGVCLEPNSAARRTEARTLPLHGPHRPAHLAARRILSTHVPGMRRGRGETEGGRGGKENRGAAPPSPATPLQLPVSKSDIYWEINTPWGSSFKPPRKHNGGGGSCGLGHRTKTPDLSWRQDGIPWEQRPSTLVPFDFKGKS